MLLERSSTPDKDKKAYEKSVAKYKAAYWAYDDNNTDSTLRAWQESMAALLIAYDTTNSRSERTQDIPLAKIATWHLISAMATVIDGKDTDLFHVTPSDRYDRFMRLAKMFAVGYVADRTTDESQQEKKRWIMKEYGISRSLLNEWIRTTDPVDYDDKDIIDRSRLFQMVDHYRKNKLTGRRRKP